MRERATPSELTDQSGRRRTSIIIWMLTVVMSFTSGVFVTLLLQGPLPQYSFQEFFNTPSLSIASIALGCFVLGFCFAYLFFRSRRKDANRMPSSEHRTRDKAETPRTSQPGSATQPDESSPEPPPYAVQRESTQDIAAVISEMSDAIRANL